MHASAKQTNKLVEAFITIQAKILNAEYLVSGPISLNWSNPTGINSLKIPFYICSPDFCLYKLEKACSSFMYSACPYRTQLMPHHLSSAKTCAYLYDRREEGWWSRA